MRILIVLGILLLAGIANAQQCDDTVIIHVCEQGGEVVIAYDQPARCRGGGSTRETNRCDLAFLSYVNPPPPTQDEIDDHFNREELARNGPLLKALAKLHSLTTDELLALLRAER